MQKITPFLWFNDNMEEALHFYTSLFKNAGIGRLDHLPNGKVMTGTFRLGDLEFYALNGGPKYSFTPSTSFFVVCETEEEINELWASLIDGGFAMMEFREYPFSEKYGWVQDKYGLSWQLSLTRTPQKINPVLMFSNELSGKAEEAIHFYTSVFCNSSLLRIFYYEAGEMNAEGKVKHAAFSLDGCQFMAMDSPYAQAFGFTPAISLFVNCETQEEVDYFWDKLSEGGKKDRCGWLSDKYGVSWQIIPDTLGRLMRDPDPVKSGRVMQAMMKMEKIVIRELQDAYDLPKD